MNKSILIFCLVSLVAVPLWADWQGEVRISETADNSYANSNGGWGIAADADSVYMVWYDYYGEDQIRYHSFSVGNPPAVPVEGTAINHTTTADHRYPSLAISEDKLHVDWTYVSSGAGRLYLRERDGSSWGYAIEHGKNDTYMSSSAIADDAFGNTHCTFSTRSSSQTGMLYYQRRNAGSSSFGDLVKVFDPGYCKRQLLPSICVTTDNSIHIVWRQTSYYEVGYASSSDGVSWTVGLIPDTRHDFSHDYSPSICHDAEDNLYVAYRDYDTPYQIAVVKCEDGVWTDPVIVSNNDNNCYQNSICCDAFGNVWVVWGEYHATPDAMEVAYNRLPAGADFATGWEVPQPLTADDGYASGDHLDITADELGNVHVYWDDARNSYYDIYYNWFLGALPADAGVVSIDAPSDTVWSGHTYVPQVTVANLWEESETFDVACEFDSAGTVVYSDTVTVTDLVGEDSIQISFADWTSGVGTYEMTVTTLLEGDGNPGNDQLAKTVTALEPPRDVAVISINAPEDTVWSAHTYVPQATVVNLWEESETFDVICEFDSAGTVVYSDTVNVTDLAGGDSAQLSFADWTAGEGNGVPYTMTVTALLEGDVNPVNDELSKQATAIWPPRDVAALTILTPPDYVWSGLAHTPRAVVANFWEEPETFDVRCEFDSAGVVIYSEIATVTGLAGGDSIVVEFAPWSAGATDEFTYLMTVTTLLSQDLNPDNDTTSKLVYAVKAVADVDVQDYAGNLSANTMELTGVTNSIVVGSYIMVNPDELGKNVDLYDGPANVDLTLSYSATDLVTYDGRWCIGSENVDPDLNTVASLVLGDAALNIVQVYIPKKHVPSDNTYVGKVTITGEGEGAVDSDEFTLKVNVVPGDHGSWHPCSFGGEPLAEGNQLYWTEFGLGEQGFNLYRAETESEDFVKLNEIQMNINQYTDYEVGSSQDYQYKLGLAMADGREVLIGPLSLTSSEEVGSLVLDQNWPNPWNQETEIRYFLPRGANNASLRVYDISGKLVKTLASGIQESGSHTVYWNGTDETNRNVPSGVYFYILRSDNEKLTRKMLLMK